jgi:type VI secretion system protein ImpK
MPGSRPPQAPSSGEAAAPGQFTTTGINPLVAAAGSLLALVGQLRGSGSHPDVQGLSLHVSQEIANFEGAAASRGESRDTIQMARYALCTLIDEVVMNTPWGSRSAWANETQLMRFHHEAIGGERFFQIVQRSLQNPAQELHLLEFLFICLSLGLEGRYRSMPDGQRQLQAVSAQVYEAVRRQRGDFERTLSPRWQGVQDRRPKLARYVPMWVVAAVAAGLLLVAYLGFLFALNSRSDPVVARIAAVGRDIPVEANTARPPPAPSRVGLAKLLEPETGDGLVRVEDLPDRSVVTMWQLFPVGDAQLNPDRLAVLGKVAQALARFKGPIIVTGHTDNVPIRSLRYPSNWVLSERRAETVSRELQSVLPVERIKYEGLGDSKPLQLNDSDANRAINRRVEITLFPQGPGL